MSTPQLMVSWRAVYANGVAATIGAAGRKRAMARAVAPVLVQAMITAAFSSTEARQAAAPIAAVMRAPLGPFRAEVLGREVAPPAVAVELEVGSPRDAGHGRHRVDRVDTDRRLAREHHGARPVENCVGNVGHLGPGGHRRVDHGLEHLGGRYDRAPPRDRGADEFFLDMRDFLESNAHPEVSPGDHEGVGRLQDVVDVLERLGGLHLGANQHALSGQRPTVSRSEAVRTNETATLSMPSSSSTSRRSKSSGVGVLSASLEAGAVTPGRPWTLPPATTLDFID